MFQHFVVTEQNFETSKCDDSSSYEEETLKMPNFSLM